ncbi:hypothetical protein QA601_00390 [Chitinispirillales bacterium ANBcel5]|uniref:hypothetical protein n=1 Tax=Cellulosispirillum alkaliphilum TaxID=3039283 RepID=UPI002A4F8B6E|nr:hypothetical protein [Chitinispirillales bacterium ANBcel5]
MKSLKLPFLFSMLLLPSICTYLSAEAINVRGIVQEFQTRNAIVGAEVELKGQNLSNTTDSEGRFEIVREAISVGRALFSGSASSATLHGSKLEVVLRESSPVSVSVFTMSGRKIYDFDAGVLNAGANLITLPMDNFGAGAFMINVTHEGNRNVFRYVSSLRNAPGITASKTSASQRSATVAQATLDSLIVTAEGYQTRRMAIHSYDQYFEVILEPERDDNDNGGPIDYEPGSRLNNINKSCDGMMPSPVSGNQGWASRYWDCCMPHCSWHDNAQGNVSRNCDINDNEIPGNQSSGCEHSGVAYTCYDHSPFAVCEDLAYGFAALPVSGNVCGRCFQIDFDGGFQHGNPRATHQALAGKTMIVMASNVGGDVREQEHQVDIMIPGGGLGLHTEGCRKQWNVDVNNESMVGATFGGFATTCEDQLGWNYSAEDMKGCVRNMCDNLFGNDDSLHSLWEGCIWFVDWMHAANNPTFTYREVDCPPELVDLY